MSDPYSVLGISPEASDEEVKRAYRDLARKYHPDNYQNNPLADLAEEKMKEINEAYAAITRSRSGGGTGPGNYGFQGQQYQRQYTYQQQSTDNGALYSQGKRPNGIFCPATWRIKRAGWMKQCSTSRQLIIWNLPTWSTDRRFL